MARCPAALWRPVAGHTDGPMRAYTGVVLHVNQSRGNLYNWVAGPNRMSCHFQVYENGSAEQYLDTAVMSWCQAGGNATYLSIETEGYASDPLTPAQVMTVAKILAWCHQTHGIPLRVADMPGQAGLGWHGMGGAAWGGHPGCPGVLRKAQRIDIIQHAQAILDHTPEDDMTPEQANQLMQVYNGLYYGGSSTPWGMPLVSLLGRMADQLTALTATVARLEAGADKPAARPS